MIFLLLLAGCLAGAPVPTSPAPRTPALLTAKAARAQVPGNTVTVRAVVLNGAELGNIRYVQDGNPGDTRVRYGLDPKELKELRTDAALTTRHSLTLDNLISGTPYYVEVSSRNAVGTETAPVPFITASGKRGRARQELERRSCSSGVRVRSILCPPNDSFIGSFIGEKMLRARTPDEQDKNAPPDTRPLLPIS